jgi:hypothetical protein
MWKVSLESSFLPCKCLSEALQVFQDEQNSPETTWPENAAMKDQMVVTRSKTFQRASDLRVPFNHQIFISR